MSAQQVIFLVLSALMLGSSLGVVLARNQVYAAMSLVGSFFFLAADYALLGAHTIAILQVLVYAGAIMVLFLFVIMLLAIQDAPRSPFLQLVSPGKILVVLAAAAIGVVLVSVSLGASVTARITQVGRNADGNTFVVFDHSPFRGSAYGVGPLGSGFSDTTHFDVLSVGMQVPPQNVIEAVGNAPRVGEVVQLTEDVPTVSAEFGTVHELGTMMYGRYLLPFEVTSLLLLVSIVGAVIVAKGKI